MNVKQFGAFTTGLVAVGVLARQATRGTWNQDSATGRSTGRTDRKKVDRLIADLPPRPRVAALQMLEQYGVPQEATSEQLIWHETGPFKRITVTRAEHHHDFPFPHMDYLERTISYLVPVEKAADLSAYDASLTFDRTRGEMSARCDLEGHNILTLNLAHEIVCGKKDTKQARQAFSHQVLEDWAGEHPSYVESLQVEPAMASTTYSDTPTIPGSPQRAAAVGSEVKTEGDAEVLGFVVAANLNEILAAAHTSKEQPGPAVLEYATMLHKKHGKNLQEALDLGRQIGVTPIVTPAVDSLLVKGARELAALVPLRGKRYGRAYMEAMIVSHQEALTMIDSRLMHDAESQSVKRHLTQTSEQVAMHLEKAKHLHAELRH
jgi:predicted outer membrane protein